MKIERQREFPRGGEDGQARWTLESRRTRCEEITPINQFKWAVADNWADTSAFTLVFGK